ncbi:MAG: hypothetical protein AAF004_12745 [Pseudomonadota bacterium]
MNAQQWLSVEKLPRFSDPLTALLWGSRIYLVHATSGEPTPPALNLLFSHVLSSDVQPAMIDALDFLMFHSTVPLDVHALDCECVSIHEMALADAIRAIQIGSIDGYCEAMKPVLTGDDALAIGPCIQALANAITTVERRGFVQSANVIAPRAFAPAVQRSQWH